VARFWHILFASGSQLRRRSQSDGLRSVRRAHAIVGCEHPVPGLLGSSRRLHLNVDDRQRRSSIDLVPAVARKGSMKVQRFRIRITKPDTCTAGTCLRERIPTARMPERGLRDSEDLRTPLCGHGIMWRGAAGPRYRAVLGIRC
jgi:hypothetical protein